MMSSTKKDHAKLLISLLRTTMQAFVQFFHLISRRYFTIMLIPHNDGKPISFHVRFLAIIFCALLLLAILLGFFFATASFVGREELVRNKGEQLTAVEGNLDLVLDELSDFIKVSELFNDTLDDTLNEAGIERGQEEMPSTLFSSGDLLSFSNIYQTSGDEPQQLQSLKTIAEQLRVAVQPLEQVRNMLMSQSELLTSLPNKWPIVNNIGKVTMEFGPNIHPVTGQWYLHKGFDISGPFGTSILASADGKIIDLGYDPGYGLNVWIRHRYGFRTHYSHLQSIAVSEGQEVKQGQRIGTLGTTGISTGPHLDFQIWIGTEVVDPAAFLKISNSFARWTGNR